MAKIPNSVIGVDLGRHTLKSVLLQRKGGNRIVLGNYAQIANEGSDSPEALALQLKQLFKEMGGSAKACAVAVSSADAIIRIIEQPDTPPNILRDALRFNGMSLLNQDCKEFVLDCDFILNGEHAAQPATPNQPRKYLVGGLPRIHIAQIDNAFQKTGPALSSIQLGPICSFNAFEFGHEETFANEAFMLVDIGHVSSTVTVGVKRELILVRSIEYGGKTLADALVSHAEADAANPMKALEQGDEIAVETARMSLAGLTREISSSIGFFEGRREENIAKIFVSGGPARSKAILNVLTEELQIPCEAWSAFEKCEVAVAGNRKEKLAADQASLNIACGAAAEFLKGR